MNTSLPLLNVGNGAKAVNGAAGTGNPADSFTADVSFGQMLNSQVNHRYAEQDAQQQARQPDDTPKAQPAAPAASSASTTTTASTEKKPDDDKKVDDDSDDDTTTTAASAQLLALVANLEQNAVKPVDGRSQNTDADLLAQAKRALPRQSALGDDKPLSTDADANVGGKKIDFAALQSSAQANAAKKQAAGPELSGQNATDAALSAKSDKPAVDLGATDTKAPPKEDSSALAARGQAAKVASELSSARQDVATNAAAPTPVALPAMQQALAASQPQAVFNAVYTDKIQPNVGSAGWDQAVGQKITWMVSGGIQSASLTLNPPDLGPMQVVLSVHNQQADATFITAQPEVKQALEQAMPKLREMMDQAGIQLGQATVNTGTPNQGQGQPGQQARAPSGSSFGGGDDAELAGVGTVQAAVTNSGLGLVDTFA